MMVNRGPVFAEGLRSACNNGWSDGQSSGRCPRLGRPVAGRAGESGKMERVST